MAEADTVLTQKLRTGFTEVASKVKDLRARVGVLTDLTTTFKVNVVGAVNEVNANITNLINDVADSTTTTNSSSRINQKIANAAAQVKTDLIGTASSAADTFGEIQTIIANDESGAAAMSTAIGNRLRIDANGGYTSGQKQQARDNMNVYSRDEIGDISAFDPVATFNAALNS